MTAPVTKSPVHHPQGEEAETFFPEVAPDEPLQRQAASPRADAEGDRLDCVVPSRDSSSSTDAHPVGSHFKGWHGASLVLSLAAHIGVVTVLGQTIARSGLDAPSVPPSIHVVIEATRPSNFTASPAGSPSQAHKLVDNAAVRTQAPVETTDRESAAAKPIGKDARADPVRSDETAVKPEAGRAADTPPPTFDPHRDEDATKDARANAEKAPPVVANSDKAHPLDAPVPIPSARPAHAPVRMPSVPQRRATSGGGSAAPEKTAHTTASPKHRQTKNAARPSSRSPGGRSGEGRQAPSVSRGDQLAYARALHRRIQRFKRFPKEAEREGLSGSAHLSITIDRRGRLVAVRLRRSSGSDILDREALAEARRASPYPAPPAGLGGATVTFDVTLRFSR